MKLKNWLMPLGVLWVICLAVFALAANASGQTTYRPLRPVQPAPVVTQTANVADLTWSVVESEPGYLILHDWKVCLGKIDPVNGVWVPNSGKPVDLRELIPNGHKPTGALPAKGKCAATSCDCENCEGAGCKCGPTTPAAGQLPPKEIKPRDNGPAPVPPGGVDVSQLRGDKSRYTIGDRESSRAEVMTALQSAKEIPDDSRAVRLTLIGCVTCREEVQKDLDSAPALAPFKGKLVVQSYASDHWRVRDGGFQTPPANSVMVYVQDAAGAVLWRQEGYDGGAPALAKALRDKCPTYDPAKDPGPASPAGSAMWWLIGGGAVVGSVLYARKKKGK